MYAENDLRVTTVSTCGKGVCLASHGQPQRLDVRNGEIKQCAIDGKFALQEICFVPRETSKSEGDGWLMTIAGNFDTMSSGMIITDALHLENGVVATVMLPFRLRSGTHTNWFPQLVLPPIRDELT